MPGQREAQRPRVVGGGEDLDGGLVVPTAEARSAAYHAKPEIAVCSGADGGGLAQAAAQLDRLLPGGDRVASRSVRYSSTESASSRSARGRCRRPRGAARPRRTRRPPGARPSGTPRPPRRARSAGSGRRRPAAAAWWASTLGSPPTARARRSSPRAAPARRRARPRRGPPTGRSRGGTRRRGRAGRADRWRRAPRPSPSRRRARRAARRRRVRGRRTSSSRQCRAGGASPAVRASTASRTLSGSGDSGWARIWLTKNGLPAVRRCTSAGSSRCPSSERGDGGPAQRGQLQRGARPVRRPGRPGPGSADGRRRARRGTTAPSAAAASRSGGRGSARGRASPRRPSAGPRRRTRAGGRAGRRAPRRRSRAGPRCRAAGRRRWAQFARDVAQRAERAGRAQRVAHAPQRLRVARVRSTKARSRTVLPMPASPATRTTDAVPGGGPAARASSTSRGCSRSSSRTPRMVRATTRAAQWADPRSHTGRGARTQGRTWVRASVAVCEGVRAAELRP